MKELLASNGIETESNSKVELMLLALDNDFLKREDIIAVKKEPKEQKEKRPVGRPRKYPPKEFDTNKVIDPKFERLKNIRRNPKSVNITNVETGEVTIYPSIYKAEKHLNMDGIILSIIMVKFQKEC